MNQKLLVCFAIFFTTFKGLLAQNTEVPPPNIIFILTDDQRFDAIGYAGNQLIHTPEMDKLARAGTFFDKAMVTTPICAASRASILTGLYERTHNFNFQTGNVREQYMALSYPKLLKEAGYLTGFFGKYGIRYDDLGKQFDIYDSYDRNNAFKDYRGYYYKTLNGDTVHLTRYTGQQALDFIDQADADRPFCLSLSFSAPHAHDGAKEQYFWQDQTDHLLQNTTMPGPDLGEDKYFNILPQYVRDGFNRLRWTWRYDTPEKYQHSVKGYYRMISGVDLEIGKIRKKLSEKGLSDNTVIILIGDNGYFLGERQLAGKWLLYDNSVRVPLIVYDPRVKKQVDSRELALNVDVSSTIVDLAGLKQPGSWQGQSLMPIVRKTSKSLERDTVLIEHLWEFKHIQPSEGVRTHQWKYFRYVNDKATEELYNLNKDPKEINNLAANPAYTDVLVNLRKKCDQLISEKSDGYTLPPYNLRVEFIRSTAGVLIRDSKPEYTWTIPGTAVTQSAYQILVASTPENINNNNGDIWDSGQVRGGQSTEVEHGGVALSPGETYFWKVRVWDIDNRMVRYSDSQRFTVGARGSIMTTHNKFQLDRIKPESMSKKGDVYHLDFGRDAFASLEFDYQAKSPHTIVIHLGEQLTGEGVINRKPIGNIRYQRLEVPVSSDKSTYQLQIQLNERNTKPVAVSLPDSFPVLIPFRYLEIENAQNIGTKDNFTQLAYHSYWEDDASMFSSSDEILNQIWDLCKYSIKATTFAGLYVDGDRERIPYEADAYLNQLSHYTTDQEYSIARATLEYFMDHPTWPTEWQLHVALMAYVDYMYTGNNEFIKKYYEGLKVKSLMDLSGEDGLITSKKTTPDLLQKLGFDMSDPQARLEDIVDWPKAGWGGDPNVKGERDGFVFRPYNTVINSFFYENMRIMAVFARELGKSAEAAEFELLAIKVKNAINEKLFDPDKGVYVDGKDTDHASLHANMLPLAFGIVPEDRIERVVQHIQSRGMACSVYGAQYLMDALYKACAADYALNLLTSQSDRSWYNMIRAGSTITLEAWDAKYKNNLDWNHAWGAVPANVIPRGLWGIRPKTPGFAVAQIKPQMSNLKNSSIKVPTIRGPIEAQYQFLNRRLQTYRIKIPANMVAEFEMEIDNSKEIKLNGEKINPLFKNVRLTPGEHLVEVKVNSF